MLCLKNAGTKERAEVTSEVEDEFTGQQQQLEVQIMQVNRVEALKAPCTIAQRKRMCDLFNTDNVSHSKRFAVATLMHRLSFLRWKE